MQHSKLVQLFTNAHSSLNKEAIAFLAQDTATVVSPILKGMVENMDVSASFRKGTANKDAEVSIIAKASEKVGASPLLQHLAFVQSVEKAFSRHGIAFENQSLPLTPGIRVRQTEKKKTEKKTEAGAAPAAPAK